eukprot:TRINITY_DN3243_c0_g1_i1.p1 TRINITY_DN3243_c0_g1~~TRINITY_DN3243_c0_g1_i1.p1  ORF type:complete len:479 (+),score=95.21 TRINITY_DN3243_c0_g1_i1:34-1437(+)
MATIVLLFLVFLCPFGTTSSPVSIAIKAEVNTGNDLCPEHIGPPCPRNFNNTMDDYSGQPIYISGDLRSQLTSLIDSYAEAMYTGASPFNESDTDYTMFTGQGGRAFFFLRLYHYAESSDKKLLYLERAQEYIETSLDLLSELQQSGNYDERYVSFFEGKVGTYAVASMIYQLAGNEEQSQYYLNQVVKVFALTTSSDYNELDCGHAGLIYTGLLVNNFFQQKIISDEDFLRVGQILMDQGISNAKSTGVDYLWWTNPWFPDIIFPDSSHGISGILYLLLSIPSPIYSNSTYLDWITSTLNYLVSTQFPDGNYPTPQQDPYPLLPDQLVQWDHGAPSYVSLMSQAGSIYRSINISNANYYLDSANRASDAMWERGLLTKGLCFCHGIGGNIYMFFEQYYFTRNSTALWRALQFTQFAIDPNNVSQMRVSDTPYSMFQGTYSIAMLYSELLSENWGNVTSMPSWRPNW